MYLVNPKNDGDMTPIPHIEFTGQWFIAEDKLVMEVDIMSYPSHEWGYFGKYEILKESVYPHWWSITTVEIGRKKHILSNREITPHVLNTMFVDSEKLVEEIEECDDF